MKNLLCLMTLMLVFILGCKDVEGKFRPVRQDNVSRIQYGASGKVVVYFMFDGQEGILIFDHPNILADVENDGVMWVEFEQRENDAYAAQQRNATIHIKKNMK